MSSPRAGADATLVVIPALNEAARLGAVLDRLHTAAPHVDVLVIDDGSRDATAEAARRHGARVVSHVFNLGYGAALQTGYKVADRDRYAFVVQMDADGQHDPADVPRLLEPLAAGHADVAIGSRFVAPSSYRMDAARSAGRVFFQRVLVAFGGPRIADPTSGFQALTRDAFRFCCEDFFPADFPDIDVLLRLHRSGFRLLEVPVEMAPNPAEHASMHGGLRAVYYTYKMLLSTFRSRLGPSAGTRRESAEERREPQRA
ncbi:MAG TPA: glycosyltransferase family 2 protein [Candidatus Binatia bacterium]|nr:glycosyltransferase family 2 protein [Candidatus Binatia bacterium]